MHSEKYTFSLQFKAPHIVSDVDGLVFIVTSRLYSLLSVLLVICLK